MHSMGRSVYWSRMFKEERDPTLVVLGLLWYAIYAWDETMEKLYAHICFLVRTGTFAYKAAMYNSPPIPGIECVSRKQRLFNA